MRTSRRIGSTPTRSISTICARPETFTRLSACRWIRRPAPACSFPAARRSCPRKAIDRLRLFVRDLISGGSTTLEAIPYIRENSPDPTGASGAQMVNAGTLKQEVTMNFLPDTALVQKIAAWLSATYEILQDAPTLRSYIDARLAYMLPGARGRQLLNGTGTTPQLKGIFTYATNQTSIAATNDAMSAVAQMCGKIGMWTVWLTESP